MDDISDVAIVALVSGVVELAKRVGLPTRYAGLAAVLAATALVALRDLALGNGEAGLTARWLLLGLVYGLAAAGLYSQAQRLPRGTAAVDTGRASD